MTIVNELFENGFAVQKDVFCSQACLQAKQASQKLMAHLLKTQNSPYLTEDGISICLPHVFDPESFLKFTDHQSILKTVSSCLQEEFCLSDYTTANAQKNSGNRIHIDARMPTKDKNQVLQMTALVCLDDFKKENGAIRFWPKTHDSGIDPRAYRGKENEVDGAIQCQAKRGDVIYFFSNLWHDAGKNISGEDRWSLNIFYSRWWLKPNYDFTKCGKEIFDKLNTTQKKLFGFGSQTPSSRKEREYTLLKSDEMPKTYEEAHKHILNKPY